MEIGAFADTCQHLYRSAFFFFLVLFLALSKTGTELGFGDETQCGAQSSSQCEDDDFHEERQQNRATPSSDGGSSATPSRCHNRRSN
ncbi:hypothetical protein YC2023_001628 [Brassica napus]